MKKLTEAIENRDIKNVEFLLMRGADPNYADSSGETALMYAVENQELDIVKLLIKRGADVNMRDNEGLTALHYAVIIGNLSIVKYLTDKTALGVSEKYELIKSAKEYGHEQTAEWLEDNL